MPNWTIAAATLSVGGRPVGRWFMTSTNRDVILSDAGRQAFVAERQVSGR
ncbi:hypothetical protein [Methylobacterium sp. JK268]